MNNIHINNKNNKKISSAEQWARKPPPGSYKRNKIDEGNQY